MHRKTPPQCTNLYTAATATLTKITVLKPPQWRCFAHFSGLARQHPAFVRKITMLRSQCFAQPAKTLREQQLRDLLEVFVPGNESEVVLQSERRDPEIVIRHWSTGFLQLNEQAAVLLCSLARWQQNSNRGLGKQLVEQNFIPSMAGASIESSLDFAQDDKRNP